MIQKCTTLALLLNASYLAYPMMQHSNKLLVLAPCILAGGSNFKQSYDLNVNLKVIKKIVDEKKAEIDTYNRSKYRYAQNWFNEIVHETSKVQTQKPILLIEPSGEDRWSCLGDAIIQTGDLAIKDIETACNYIHDHPELTQNKKIEISYFLLDHTFVLRHEITHSTEQHTRQKRNMNALIPCVTSICMHLANKIAHTNPTASLIRIATNTGLQYVMNQSAVFKFDRYCEHRADAGAAHHADTNLEIEVRIQEHRDFMKEVENAILQSLFSYEELKKTSRFPGMMLMLSSRQRHLMNGVEKLRQKESKNSIDKAKLNFYLWLYPKNLRLIFTVVDPTHPFPEDRIKNIQKILYQRIKKNDIEIYKVPINWSSKYF